MQWPRRWLHATPLAFGLVACSPGGGSTTETPTASPQDLRVASPFTHGSADLLCAEVMLAAGFGAHAELHAASPLADAALAERLEHAALDHLRSVAMGAGNGAELAGSRRIRRLALLPGAPPDLNQNGQNWDETLLAERTRIATTAGAAPLPGSWQTFLPWQYGSSALAQPLLDSASSHPANWRTTANAGQSRVSLRALGAALGEHSRRGALFGIASAGLIALITAGSAALACR